MTSVTNKMSISPNPALQKASLNAKLLPMPSVPSRNDSGQGSEKPVKSPFGYFGSKQRLAIQIAEMLPPHNAWVEAFCGSAAVTMAKKAASLEVINDADLQIVNVFRQLRENPTELIELVEFTPYAREEFEDAYKKKDVPDCLEQARRFLVACMMTVNGAMGSNGDGARHSGFSYSQAYARNGQEARVNRWNSLPKRLASVVQRLKNVRVENRDARELLRMFLNRPATLVYLDPPYLMERDTKYKVDANDETFHQELLELCCQAKCMVLLSGYENPLYSSFLNKRDGWERETIATYTRDTKGKDLARTEILWKNKFFIKAATTGSVPIRLTKKEKKNGKTNPTRK
jgi:DNA adenine methylase